MAIGIAPTVDYGFKLLLGSPEHPAITLHFISAILGPEIQITDGQIGEGDDYTRLRPAISICVLDAIMFRQSPQIHSDFRLRTRDGGLNLTDGPRIHLLELPGDERNGTYVAEITWQSLCNFASRATLHS